MDSHHRDFSSLFYKQEIEKLEKELAVERDKASFFARFPIQLIFCLVLAGFLSRLVLWVPPASIVLGIVKALLAIVDIFTFGVIIVLVVKAVRTWRTKKGEAVKESSFTTFKTSGFWPFM